MSKSCKGEVFTAVLLSESHQRARSDKIAQRSNDGGSKIPLALSQEQYAKKVLELRMHTKSYLLQNGD
jgi:hypothetical protein